MSEHAPPREGLPLAAAVEGTSRYRDTRPVRSEYPHMEPWVKGAPQNSLTSSPGAQLKHTPTPAGARACRIEHPADRQARFRWELGPEAPTGKGAYGA